MRVSLDTLGRAERDTVSNLAIGYEMDAANGETMMDQLSRLSRWRREGWSRRWYHYNILAMLIGYARARNKSYNLELPGTSGY